MIFCCVRTVPGLVIPPAPSCTRQAASGCPEFGIEIGLLSHWPVSEYAKAHPVFPPSHGFKLTSPIHFPGHGFGHSDPQV